MNGMKATRSKGPTVVCLVERDSRWPEEFCLGSHAALREAAHAACRDGELIVAHVIPALPRTFVFSGGELSNLLAEQEPIVTATERWLRATVRAALPDRAAQVRVLAGMPPRELAHLAAEVVADLVVVPRHWATTNPVAKFLAGSPVDMVKRYAGSPVLVAGGPTSSSAFSVRDAFESWRRRHFPEHRRPRRAFNSTH